MTTGHQGPKTDIAYEGLKNVATRYGRKQLVGIVKMESLKVGMKRSWTH